VRDPANSFAFVGRAPLSPLSLEHKEKENKPPLSIMAFVLPPYAGLYAWLAVTLYIAYRIRRSLR